jgi:hypothetical protein
MKEIGNFILRIIIKSIIIGSFVFAVIYIIRNEHYYNRIKKEMKTDSVPPVTRSYKVLPITEDSLYLQRLERETKKLLK